MNWRKLRTFLAVSLMAATSSAAFADDIELDLEYDSGAMTWAVYAEVTDGTPDTVDGSNGIGAIRILLDNIDFGTDGDAINLNSIPIGAIDPIDPGGPNQRSPFLQTTGGTIDILYGQDFSEMTQSVVPFVGTSGRVLIVDGTYSGSIPDWGDDDSMLTTDGVFLNTSTGPFGSALDADNIVLNAAVDVGGVPEDLNMDGFVDGLDLGILLGNWNQVTTPSGGELNGITPVDGLDLGILLGAWNPPPVPPLAAAIPEPAGITLLSISLVGLLTSRRKQL